MSHRCTYDCSTLAVAVHQPVPDLSSLLSPGPPQMLDGVTRSEIGSIESYDLANGPEYIRSMRTNRYGDRIFSFITLFDAGIAHPATGDRQNRYTLWYRLLHYGVSGAPIWCAVVLRKAGPPTAAVHSVLTSVRSH